MKEISIVGATFYGNRGAEAMLSTSMGRLREACPGDLNFNVFTYYPKSDCDLVNDPRISIYSSTPAYLVMVLFPVAMLYRLFGVLRLSFFHRFFPQSILSLARSEVLICLAGVSFVEGRTKFIPFNIATILPAMVLGVPVVKFSQAMGPFKSYINRMAARIFLGRCRQVFTRGETTHAYLRDLFSTSDRYQRADDAAFLFKSEDCLSQQAAGLEDKLSELKILRQSGKTIVGVCPSVVIAKRAETAGWDYQQRMQELISGLVEKGYAVALYPNATRGEDMDKTHNNDLPLLAEIEKKLSSNISKHVVSFSGSLNAAQVHQIINSCDVQAVSRFHAMVASLASCIPVMVIGWSHKYLEVMERFGQQDMVLDYKKGSVEPVIDCVDRLVAERTERAQQISNALPAVQKLSNVQIDYIAKLLKCSA
ncbi:polysaccharide pyruvyl transferase family protein [Billgrantia kenyensis]|uniref:Polysaccharide pyruvyl transferase family protein n=1 Tax=Billgrantia kenyensis TaxID=321266 RepID=A0A7V9W111_9GAMM|nr:polysaccharide pyruvyl transferase family protein [Halomonas kenyensis]MBA2778992.1 polysaccharide pyruvyl transferase family protein [Halomonas kenyensis]MCG6662919.1 hypothetical protein [Halomonas kenyensis]